jgi:hypothetical protein
MKSLEYIIQKTLSSIIAEQAPAAPTAKETDNAPSDAENSPFTPAEEKFLGKFDAYGTRHIGIIYSLSDIGIREFITRSGANLNISPDILVSLLRKKAIKIVPYTGFGRNDDYTIELKLSLDDVKGLGSEDKAKAEAGSGASGAPAGGEAPTPPAPAGPGPEVAWVIPYGELIKESTKIAKQLITEKSKDKTKSKIQADKSRVMKRLPKGYINQLERIIDMIGKKTHNSNEKQRMVADILDNLSVNLKLSDKQIRKSFEFFKNQKRLQESMDLTEAVTISNSEIANAVEFWNEMDDALNHFNFDETAILNSFKTRVKSKTAAIYIDAIGIILKQATDPNDEFADKFLNAKVKGWSVLEVPIILKGYPVFTLKRLIEAQSMKLYVWGEREGILSNGPLLYLTADKTLKSAGVGRITGRSWDIIKFYPSYTMNDVYTILNALLAPYKKK